MLIMNNDQRKHIEYKLTKLKEDVLSLDCNQSKRFKLLYNKLINMKLDVMETDELYLFYDICYKEYKFLLGNRVNDLKQ